MKEQEATEIPPATEKTLAASLSSLVGSLALTAEAWSSIKRAGACACCAARLAGCRKTAAYDCDEEELRTLLDFRFAKHDDSTCSTLDDTDAPAKGSSTSAVPAENGSHSKPATTKGDLSCTLCLGLLQSEVVPLRIAPRERPSSEMHGDDNRACVSGRAWSLPSSPQQPAPDAPLATKPQQERADSSKKSCDEEDLNRSPIPEGNGTVCVAVVAPGEQPVIAAAPSDIADQAAADTAGIVEGTVRPTPSVCIEPQYRRVRMVRAIAECTAARGYTVSSFNITAAVPACLAVRDAAFMEARGNLLLPSCTADKTHASTSAKQEQSYFTRTESMVSVKEALKIGLVGGLETHLGGASFDVESDFIVEVAAKAPEADAHAMAVLLEGPALSQSGAKPPGWPGAGRWAKKRQRREEHRNPGLTVGAVKKGLSMLDDDGRKCMRRWVDGLAAVIDTEKEEGRGGKEAEEIRFGDGTEKLIPVAGRGKENEGGATADGMEVEASLRGLTGTTIDHNITNDKNIASNTAASTAVAATMGSPTTVLTPSGNKSMVARCEITIRRQSIHFWGRYTKLSRNVPQTPWMKGFFSVQEAVSEPFEAFSGCVEGILHGAGREDVDVRMLGKGRPFSLELADSLRSVDEIKAQLSALADEVNAATGRKNAGGGVSVSRLRVARLEGGDLPCDVQKVGEGKRKHYRCVVWVSRAVNREEVRAMCDQPELVVQQATPLRVLHRRTLLDRPRSIFDMSAEWINAHFFVLDLTTSAGTYIKEFVHGDLGRTVPSVGSLLGCRADILQLDVTKVEDKWSMEEEEIDSGVGLSDAPSSTLEGR